MRPNYIFIVLKCTTKHFRRISKQMNYIIAAKFTHPIQRLIQANNVWITLDIGIEISEQIYQSDSWTIPRRMIIVRQKINDRPQAPKTITPF